MATTTTTAPQYRRATEYSKGIGSNLDDILGTDVLLYGFAISERQYKNDMNTFVDITLATLDDPNTKLAYHAWSKSLASRLAEIPDDAFTAGPLLVTFKEVATSTPGQKALTIE